MNQRFTPRFAVCFLFAMFAVAAGRAQDSQQPPAATPASGVLPVVANYRDADLKVVAGQVARVIRRPIVIDSSVSASARITMTSGPITPEVFYNLFLSTLKAQNLVTVESEGVIRIVPDPGVKARQGN